MPDWILKSGERVRREMVRKEYWDAVGAALAEEDGSECRVLTVDVPLPKEVLSWVVETRLTDEVFYAAVHNTTSQLSRFTTGKEPRLVPANLMLILKWRKRQGGFFLVKSANVHGYLPPEPWEHDCQKEDREWWASHAYIYDQKNSELKSSYTWRRNLIHCYLCGLRKTRTDACVVGELLTCKKCSNDIITKGYVGLTQIHGWGAMRVPGLNAR